MVLNQWYDRDLDKIVTCNDDSSVSEVSYGRFSGAGDSAKRMQMPTLAELMRSGEFEKLYTRWFEHPIPPRDINIQLPMSDALKRTIKEPNDRPNS